MQVVDRLWEYIESSIRKLLLEDITNQIRENCVPFLRPIEQSDNTTETCMA